MSGGASDSAQFGKRRHGHAPRRAVARRGGLGRSRARVAGIGERLSQSRQVDRSGEVGHAVGPPPPNGSATWCGAGGSMPQPLRVSRGKSTACGCIDARGRVPPPCRQQEDADAATGLLGGTPTGKDRRAFSRFRRGDQLWRPVCARAAGGALADRAGLQPGDGIALLLENRPEFLEIAEATRLAGLYYTPLSIHLRPHEVAYVLQDSGAKLLIASPALAALAQDLVAGGRGRRPAALCAGGRHPRLWQLRGGRRRAGCGGAAAGAAGGARIPLSSGTTGPAQGHPPAADPLCGARQAGMGHDLEVLLRLRR